MRQEQSSRNPSRPSGLILSACYRSHPGQPCACNVCFYSVWPLAVDFRINIKGSLSDQKVRLVFGSVVKAGLHSSRKGRPSDCYYSQPLHPQTINKGNYSAPPLLRTLRVLRCGRTERFHRLSAPWNRSDPSDKQAYLTGS